MVWARSVRVQAVSGWYLTWYYFGTMIGTMLAKHQKTLERLFGKPTPTDLTWTDLASMLEAAQVKVNERPSGFVALVKAGEVMVLRPPHDKPLAVSATVRDIAGFLKAVGVTP